MIFLFLFRGVLYDFLEDSLVAVHIIMQDFLKCYLITVSPFFPEESQDMSGRKKLVQTNALEFLDKKHLKFDQGLDFLIFS